MSKHIQEIGGIQALNVPLLTQPNRENECLLYAMGMVFKYCSEVHPDSAVRKNTEFLSPADLKDDHIRIRDSGWAPTQGDMDTLSESTGILNLELKYWTNSPPMTTFEKTVKKGLEGDFPTIAVVDAKLIQGLDTENGQHAVVVNGMSDSHVTVADPWGRKATKLKKEIVTDAWDTRLNRLVTIDATRQESLGDQTLESAAKT